MTIQRTDKTPGRESDEEYLRGVMATAMSGTRLQRGCDKSHRCEQAFAWSLDARWMRLKREQ